MITPSDAEGTIVRNEDGSVTITAPGGRLAKIEGVVCVNPGAPEDQQVCSKTFYKRQIYLPSEYERARREVLQGTDVIVLGINGYSSVSAKNCADWGIAPGAYDAACRALLESAVLTLTQKFPGVDVRIVHGASNMGVDKAAIDVALVRNCKQLGHSCPKFLFYVTDDSDFPVYVGNTQAEYADTFITSLNILIAANGRVHAFEHDIDAAFKKRKHVIPVNVIKSISNAGGAPAFDADNKVVDAVAAFEELVHHVAITSTGVSHDPWQTTMESVLTTIISVSRRMISPARAFSVPRV